MIIPAIAFMAVVMQAGQPGGWTWTLYEGEGPLVFANEVPDTPQLKATFECAPGSGVARVSVYGGGMQGGFATLTSGDSSATTEAEAGADRATVPVRTDHPLFNQVMATGVLKIAVGDVNQVVEVQPPFQASLRRFGELCAG